MNDKYIVKFDAGPMEQSFKFHNEQVKSVENLKKMINNDFIEVVRLHLMRCFCK